MIKRVLVTGKNGQLGLCKSWWKIPRFHSKGLPEWFFRLLDAMNWI